GSFWLRNSVPKQTVIAGDVLAWSQNIVWGDNIVWGNVLSQNSAACTIDVAWAAPKFGWSGGAHGKPTNDAWSDATLWATSIVWGNQLVGMMAGDNIVWGNLTMDNIVWGNLFDDNIVWGSTLTTGTGGIF